MRRKFAILDSQTVQAFQEEFEVLWKEAEKNT